MWWEALVFALFTSGKHVSVSFCSVTSQPPHSTFMTLFDFSLPLRSFATPPSFRASVHSSLAQIFGSSVSKNCRQSSLLFFLAALCSALAFQRSSSMSAEVMFLVEISVSVACFFLLQSLALMIGVGLVCLMHFLLFLKALFLLAFRNLCATAMSQKATRLMCFNVSREWLTSPIFNFWHFFSAHMTQAVQRVSMASASCWSGELSRSPCVTVASSLNWRGASLWKETLSSCVSRQRFSIAGSPVCKHRASSGRGLGGLWPSASSWDKSAHNRE